LDFLNLFDVPEAEKVKLVDEEENYACHVKKMLCDVDDISGEYKRAAVEYWRSGEFKPRTINCEIKILKSNINKTIAMGKQINIGGNRREKLREISAYTLDKFTEAIRKGAIIHDIDITQWALQAQ